MQMYLWGVANKKLQLIWGSMRCLGFSKGSTAKRICRTQWRHCALMLYWLRVWFKRWNKKCSAQQEQFHWALHGTSCTLHLLIFSISLQVYLGAHQRIEQLCGSPLLALWWRGQATRDTCDSSSSKICATKKLQNSQKVAK